jgi:DNA repair protein SbcC/Rad50
MLLTKLELSNFGIHRDLTFESGSNAVVGLLGKNGAGKSTILNAIKYAFTGEIDGTIEEAATYGHAKGHVEVAFIKNEKRGIIRRGVGKTPKRYLLWDGEELTNAKQIETKLGEILDVDKQAFSNACFLKQGSLNELLFGTESSREKLFIKLVNLSYCEKHKNTIELKIKNLTAGVEDLTSVIDEVVSQRTEAVDIKEEIEEELKEVTDYRKLLDALVTVKRHHEEEERILKDISDTRNEIAIHQKKIKNIENSYHVESSQAIKNLVYSVISEQEKLTTERVVAIQQVNLFRNYSSNFEKFESLQKQLKDNKTSREEALINFKKINNPVVVPESERSDLEKLHYELIQLSEWLTVQESLLGNETPDSCFKCGLKLHAENKVTEKDLEKLRNTVSEKAELKLLLSCKIKKIDDANDAILSAKANLDGLLKALEDQDKLLKDSLDTQGGKLAQFIEGAALSEDSLPSVEDLTKIMEANLEKIGEIKNIATEYDSAQSIVSRLTDLVAAKNKELQASTLKYDTAKSYIKEIDDVDEAITMYTGLQDSRLEAEGRLKQASEVFDKLNNRYTELQQRLDANKNKLQVADELKVIRDVLAKNGLPRVFIEQKFKQLAQVTADNLAVLNSDFTVDIDPDSFLSFVFDRFDGHDQIRLPMHKLSGGQKVRLCIAFLLAVQKELVTEVGFQTFDEPSTHLDEEGVERLCALFKRLQELLNTAEHQIWVCDHNPTLEESFNKTLTL